MLNRQIVIVAVVGLFSSAQADTINVPGDQPTIQAGIDAAVNGDEIVVAEGTYFEAINFNGKTITVRSTDPTDPAVVAATIIDGTGNFHVVQCVSGEGPDTVLDGFTITGGNADGSFPDDLGGGMFNNVSHPTVANCTFTGNFASAGGGGMFNLLSDPTVTNCTFSGNSADLGGGMINGGFSSPTVTNCTFSSNTAESGGGGMLHDGSVLTVTNCILWGDSPDEISGFATVTYSNIDGAFPGTGNIDADPLFVDPDNGDLRLQPASPCIDAADNTAVPEDITTDLDGNPRFLEIPETPDTGNGTLPIVDMGAFEALGGGCLAVTSQEVVCHADGTTFTVNVEGLNACTGGTSMFTFTGSGGAVGEELCFTLLVDDGGFCCSTEICVTIPDCSKAASGCPWDLDHNDSVGINDLLTLLAAWGPVPTPDPPDFDGDGYVGITDFLELLAHWGPC